MVMSWKPLSLSILIGSDQWKIDINASVYCSDFHSASMMTLSLVVECIQPNYLK